MEKKNRTVIPGPPGTGKTYRLLNHYMTKEIKENKIDFGEKTGASSTYFAETQRLPSGEPLSTSPVLFEAVLDGCLEPDPVPVTIVVLLNLFT